MGVGSITLDLCSLDLGALDLGDGVLWPARDGLSAIGSIYDFTGFLKVSNHGLITGVSMSEAQNTVVLPPHPEIERADALYGVSRWGGGFIRILENGHIGLVHPDRPEAVPADLMQIINSLNERGIAAPVLLRVADFISYRIDQINALFAAAIEKQGYKNRYQGVFPVKVNQQAQVIDRIVAYGRPMISALRSAPKLNC